jgi:hypothetical protein
MCIVSSVAVAQNGGGNVMPPSATPGGISLTDMARPTALFTTSGNNPMYYPSTPFQILYFDPSTRKDLPTFEDGIMGILTTGSNTFTVPAGRMFYVPIGSADDSPPVVEPFPTNMSWCYTSTFSLAV